MTEGTPSPRRHAPAEAMDTAATLAALDTAADALKSVASWSRQELDRLRSDDDSDREMILDAWATLADSLDTAVAELEAANRDLDRLTLRVVRDIVTGNAAASVTRPREDEPN